MRAHMKNLRSLPHLLLLAAMGAVPGTALAQQATPVIGACYNMQTGKLNVAATAAKCSTNEVFVTIPLVVGEGPRGIDGPAGPQGPQGAKGAVGATGVTGPKGSTGVDGSVGAAGAEGPNGPTGIDGLSGVEGPKGDVGPDGPAGQPGDSGPQGPVGNQGPAGPAGADGSSPSIGLWVTGERITQAGFSAWDFVVSCDEGRMPLTATITRDQHAGEIAGFRFEGASVRFFIRNPEITNVSYRASVLCAWVVW
jgi:hypothetical protein